jgi:hypothetical protein
MFACLYSEWHSNAKAETQEERRKWENAIPQGGGKKENQHWAAIGRRVASLSSAIKERRW